MVNVAGANPDYAIIMQWTGGRSGGHSYEDFHRPILATYSSICRHDSIALVAGPGFGGSDGTFPYLSGAGRSNCCNSDPIPVSFFSYFGARSWPILIRFDSAAPGRLW